MNMIFRNTSFRVKIFVVIFIAIIMPMILVSSILYKRSEQAITGQISKVVISSINFAVNNIDSSLESVTGMSTLIITDNNLISTAKIKHNMLDKEKNKKYATIRDLLSFFIARIKTQNMLAGIDSFYLYLPNQDSLIDSKTTYYDNINEKKVDFIQIVKNGTNNDSWFVSTAIDYYTLNKIETRLGQNKLVTYNKTLKDENGDIIAVLAVNVSENFLSEYYNKIQKGIPGEFIILDKNQDIVAYDNKNMIGNKTDKYSELGSRINRMKSNNGSFFLKIDDKDQFVVYSISNYTKWRYIVIIPANEILGKVYEVKNFLIIIISITTLLILGITFLLSYNFYKPLEKLVFAMQKIENRNLEVRIDDKRRDEYQKVYKGFNKMVIELNSLIKDLTNEKILKKEADIKLLQAQINPHFLYNTLDSIYSISKIKKVDEISQMVAALSKFFRISLSGGKDTVTLREAIDLVLSYLTIQNIRFKGKIDFDINVPEELMQCKVPKLILQPIVENSIYHGIEKRKGAGKLDINAQAKGEIIWIRVEDNGVGIEENELDVLRNSIENENFENSKNFALKNLNRQLKLKYGLKYGVSIESRLGEGTCVTITLPIV